MKYIFLVSAFLLWDSFMLGQNLVPNPGFEEYTPYQGMYCAGIAGFDTIVDHWESFSGTPDYFNSCADAANPNGDVPLNAWGWQYPVEGEAYASLLTYSHSFPESREYIACPLNQPLEIGEEYYISFYLSHYDGGVIDHVRCATNHFGAKFLVDPQYNSGVEGESNPYWPNNYADMDYNEMLYDSANWAFVEGWFTADSAYNWMVLGNLFDDEHTDTMELAEPGKCYGNYYIDNVCVAKNPEDCNIPSYITALPSRLNIELFPNPSSTVTTVRSLKYPILSVHIYNSHGQEIYGKEAVGQTILELDTTQWPPGIYLLCIELISKYSTTLKFQKL